MKKPAKEPSRSPETKQVRTAGQLAVAESDATSDWLFDQPRNVAVFTVQEVIDGSLPILHVCHDADDGGWQFLTGLAIDMSDARLVSLESIVRLDPSIAQLADLPEGHEATRSAADAPWQRRAQ